jgi:hypothetical protein
VLLVIAHTLSPIGAVLLTAGLVVQIYRLITDD